MTTQVDARIVKFIRKHHVMTLATVRGGVPYCCNLFYSYCGEENLFVFTSDLKTRHGMDMYLDRVVSGSVVLETKTVGIIQGLQIQGIVEPVTVEIPDICDVSAETIGEIDDAFAGRVRNSYLKRFPYALAADLSLWVLRPTFLKLTDNRLGFGKKLIWGEPQ